MRSWEQKNNVRTPKRAMSDKCHVIFLANCDLLSIFAAINIANIKVTSET